MITRFVRSASPEEWAAATRRAANDPESGVELREVREMKAPAPGIKRMHHRVTDSKGRELDTIEAKRAVYPYVEMDPGTKYCSEMELPTIPLRLPEPKKHILL